MSDLSSLCSGLGLPRHLEDMLEDLADNLGDCGASPSYAYINDFQSNLVLMDSGDN